MSRETLHLAVASSHCALQAMNRLNDHTSRDDSVRSAAVSGNMVEAINGSGKTSGAASTANAGFVSAKSRAARVSVLGSQGVLCRGEPFAFVAWRQPNQL